MRHVETPFLLRGSLLLLLGLGPLSVVWRHLNFDLCVAWFYRKFVHVFDSFGSHPAPAVATQPLAIGNEHNLSTSAESPVALGRNEAHQEFVPKLECVLGPSVRERISRTYCLDAPRLLLTLVILQFEIDLDMGIGPYVLRDCRLRRDADGVVVHTCRSM